MSAPPALVVDKRERFRTVMMLLKNVRESLMLASVYHEQHLPLLNNLGLHPSNYSRETHKNLHFLTSLASLLVRDHEITAIIKANTAETGENRYYVTANPDSKSAHGDIRHPTYCEDTDFKIIRDHRCDIPSNDVFPYL